MSLLLDALKRAEQEKLARQGQEGAAPAPAAAPESSAAMAKARKRALELESVASPSVPAAATSPAAAAAPTGEPARREAARTVFAAKQPEPLPQSSSGSKNKAIIAIIVGALVLAAAGGAYVWYEIGGSGMGIVKGPLPVAPRAPMPITPAPPASVASTQPLRPDAAKETPRPEAASKEPARPEAATKEAGPMPTVAVPKPGSLAGAAAPKPKPQPRTAEQLVMNLLKKSGGDKNLPPLKLSRTIDPPRVAPDVAQGYELLLRGDVAGARQRYEAAVAADATNLDARLGLATAAARMGDRASAVQHFRWALELDPKNPSAVAGLAALADFSRPEVLEQQLRADLAQYPRSAALHFTLGNLLAFQSRWTEAQAAYFESYRLDPENAEVAYNLAVSLDHLGQAKLAADFYQRALGAARQQNVQFDKGQVSRRIAELKP